ncbi:SDR family oxidoreductase [Buchnera aphidicola (Taiwanaphis decaspermi)]|uniref:enoyl-ACP reductase FabI n=1 Tax=Buchnera aphidicola TaxID=9 RepID=UPI0031B7F20C
MLCDLSKLNSIKLLFLKLSKYWRKFDGLVHSIAFSPNKQFKKNDYLKIINKKIFNVTNEISVYSFIAIVKESKKMLNKNSSILTISYIGSKLIIPYYNAMGPAKALLESNVRYIAYSLKKKYIRVNAISSASIKTISSSVIKNSKKIINKDFNSNLIGRYVNIYDIGKTASFLCSNFSSAINGQIIYVDGGSNIYFNDN